jgi:colicin import membrane protein
MPAARWNISYASAESLPAQFRLGSKSAWLLAFVLVSMPVVASERWVLQENVSAIDGATVKASKGYRKPNSNSYFQATVECKVASKEVEVAVASFVDFGGKGTARVPDPYATVPHLIFSMPAGRAKAKKGMPTELGRLFSLAGTSSNTIVLNAVELADSESAVPDDLVGIIRNALNRARAVRDALPIALELNNTSGQYEIVIDASPEVGAVLSRCGGDRPIFDATAVARFRALQEADEEMRRRDAEEQTRRERDPQQSLAARYAAALQAAILRNWERPDSVQLGQRCRLRIRQLPGGEVLDVQVDPSCPFDTSGRRSLESAVIRAQPLPYAGFESVFSRTLILNFVAAER